MTEETEGKRQGFTQINNDVLEALMKVKLNGTQSNILFAVIRYTMGFHREEHRLSITYLSKAVAKDKTQVNRELTGLIDRRIISVIGFTEDGTRILSINTKHEEWLDPMPNSLRNAKTHTGDNAKTHTGHMPISIQGANAKTHTKKESSLNKESKESVKENIYSSFEQFYSIYPRKVSKETARKAWIKLAKDKSFNADLIINNTLNFAETCKELNQDTKFIPYPATYLNQRRYEDYEVINPEGINIANSGQGSTLAEKNKQLLREIGGDLFSEDRGRKEVIPDYYELLPEV